MDQNQVPLIERCPLFRGDIYCSMDQNQVPLIERCPLFRGSFSEVSLYCGDILQSGWTPLLSASLRGHVAVVRLLLENGANANLCHLKVSIV